MKYKLNNTLLLLLFSLIVAFDNVYASRDCHDKAYSSCYRLKSFDFETVKPVLCCERSYQDTIIYSSATPEKDFCCEDQKCTSGRRQIVSTQNSKSQDQPAFFIFSGSDSVINSRLLNPIYIQHKTLKAIPIYTLIQAFLI